MSTIKLFGKALISEKSNLSFDVVNKVAVTKGYVIHPDVCNKEVMEFLNKIPLNYNATFYTKWSEVIEKSRFDLFVDQIMHYCSTYGTNFQGDFYVPNQVNEIENFLFADLKVILPISAESASYRACEMLYSGIALSEETIQMLIPLANSVEIDRIKNKEALMYFCKELDVLPTDTVEFVRYLVFLGTGKTLLINDKATNMSLKANKINLTELVNKFGIEKVASVFHRFKYVFLALKKGNESIVNKLRKLSNTYHKPMKIGFFEKLLSDPTCVVDLPKQLENCNNFKKILILETILRRKKGFDMRFFGIRNGKLWAKEEKMIDKKYYTVVYDIIYKSLIESLALKATTVFIPEGINLTLPTSEKSFVGNYPLGTSFDLGNSDAIVGIHWDENDNVDDLDLSLNTIDGKKYGWNSEFYNSDKSVIYSGDITSPYSVNGGKKEAVELFYASKGFTSSIVNVNRYFGEENCTYRFFLAKEKIIKMDNNYMVHPNNILFTIDMVMKSAQMILGVLTENNFVLAEFRTGNTIVSGNSITNKYTEYALETLDCYLNLKTVLKDAGFIFTQNAKIDLSNLSKDILINLLQ